MLSLYHKSCRVMRNLPQLVQDQRERGGSIIRYQRVVSCLVMSSKTNHFVWVPPHGNRFLKALPNTIPTLLFGWWSPFGFFWTIGALCSNLTGGYDATKELTAAPGGSVSLAQQALNVNVQAKRMRLHRAIVQLALLAAMAVCVFFFLNSPNQSAANGINYSKAAAAATAGVPVAHSDATSSVPDVVSLDSIALSAQPNRSAAVINGRTLLAGDRIGAYTVLAVNPRSVSLQTDDGHRVTLNLPTGK